ncbi:hypothetical protein ACVWWN_000609 [Mycobacterium sp. URHB0021]
MTTDTPDWENFSNALVSMSQPLLSSRARSPSGRYTTCEAPGWNRTRTVRPIAAEGTIRSSTGKPAGEYALAVAELPARPITPGSAAAATAATASRRAHPPKFL